MTDKYYVYRPLLDLIGFTEGTDIRPDSHQPSCPKVGGFRLN